MTDDYANRLIIVINAKDAEIVRLRSELASAREAAFEEAATLIDEGFDRGIKRKQDTCSHGKFEWEDCEQCASAALRARAQEGR